MNIEYHRFFSHRLERDMELKSYGHAGKPVVVWHSCCHITAPASAARRKIAGPYK